MRLLILITLTALPLSLACQAQESTDQWEYTADPLVIQDPTPATPPADLNRDPIEYDYRVAKSITGAFIPGTVTWSSGQHIVLLRAKLDEAGDLKHFVIPENVSFTLEAEGGKRYKLHSQDGALTLKEIN